MLVLGNGGVGKTSLIRRFCRLATVRWSCNSVCTAVLLPHSAVGSSTWFYKPVAIPAALSMSLYFTDAALWDPATSFPTRTRRPLAWISWRRHCTWKRCTAPCACSCGIPQGRRILTRLPAHTIAVQHLLSFAVIVSHSTALCCYSLPIVPCPLQAGPALSSPPYGSSPHPDTSARQTQNAGAKAAVLVFSTNDVASLEALPQWKAKVHLRLVCKFHAEALK